MKNKILLCDNMLVDSIKDYSVDELRLFYNLVYWYREESVFREKEIQELCINAEDIKKIFKRAKMSFVDILDIINNMPNKIMFIDKNGKNIGFIGVFEFFSYDFEEECFDICFTDSIMPYLDSQVEFSNINLHEVQGLSKRYSMRLYELCCKYKNQKFYNMRIDVFKRYFSVPKSYEMGEIDRTILKSGVKEIENKTNKRIKYTKVKDGKKISHIKFEFEEVENE